jgi:hypothetical protein
MKLKDYIAIVMHETPGIEEVTLEVNLYADTSVADQETGNKVKFTLVKNEL